MPRRSKRRDEDLVYHAVQALEDEIHCWREGPPRYHHPRERDRVVTMIRYPMTRMAAIGPAEMPAEADMTVQHIDMPLNEVPYFLRWKGMEAAIRKIRELDRQPEQRSAIDEGVRIDETARIDSTAAWIA